MLAQRTQRARRCFFDFRAPINGCLCDLSCISHRGRRGHGGHGPSSVRASLHGALCGRTPTQSPTIVAATSHGMTLGSGAHRTILSVVYSPTAPVVFFPKRITWEWGHRMTLEGGNHTIFFTTRASSSRKIASSWGSWHSCMAA
jgi:hypothetical protein